LSKAVHGNTAWRRRPPSPRDVVPSALSPALPTQGTNAVAQAAQTAAAQAVALAQATAAQAAAIATAKASVVAAPSFVCPHCYVSFTTRAKLSSHTKRVHATVVQIGGTAVVERAKPYSLSVYCSDPKTHVDLVIASVRAAIMSPTTNERPTPVPKTNQKRRKTRALTITPTSVELTDADGTTWRKCGHVQIERGDKFLDYLPWIPHQTSGDYVHPSAFS
jgi:hypothetical protein